MSKAERTTIIKHAQQLVYDFIDNVEGQRPDEHIQRIRTAGRLAGIADVARIMGDRDLAQVIANIGAELRNADD